MAFEYVPSKADFDKLSDTERAEILARLDADMAEQGMAYRAAQTVTDEKKRIAKEAEQRSDAMKTALQEGAVLRYRCTGTKTFKAFQAAEIPTAIYDEDALFAWALNAPRTLQQQLLKLDTQATAKWLLKRWDADKRVFAQVEFCDPFSALMTVHITGKLLPKELDTLQMATNAPEKPATVITTVTPLPTIIPTAAETAAAIYGDTPVRIAQEEATKGVLEQMSGGDSDIPF